MEYSKYVYILFIKFQQHTLSRIYIYIYIIILYFIFSSSKRYVISYTYCTINVCFWNLIRSEVKYTQLANIKLTCTYTMT